MYRYVITVKEDDSLSHAYHKGGSNYSGGFAMVNGRMNNTRDYNRDYYRKNKSKWDKYNQKDTGDWKPHRRKQKPNSSKDNRFKFKEYSEEDIKSLSDEELYQVLLDLRRHASSNTVSSEYEKEYNAHRLAIQGSKYAEQYMHDASSKASYRPGNRETSEQINSYDYSNLSRADKEKLVLNALGTGKTMDKDDSTAAWRTKATNVKRQNKK